MKKIIILLLVLLCFNYTYSQINVLDSINPRFHSRFEYVTCRFHQVNIIDDDEEFSCHLKSIENGKVYKIFIGINHLYRILYPDRIKPTKEHLYASVGKMLIYDTIYLSKKKIDSFPSFVFVKEDKFDSIVKNGFDKNSLKVIDAEHKVMNCMSAEMGYYFDRRYFRAGSQSTAIGNQCFVNFDYDCDHYLRSIPNTDFNDGNNYYYDGKGVLINIKQW